MEPKAVAVRSTVGVTTALLLLGLGACADDGHEPREAAPSTSLAQTSTPSPSAESDSALGLYGIKADEYRDFDAIVDVYFREYAAYRMSGNVSGDPGDPRYLEALFGRGWEGTPMAPYVNDVIEQSVAAINRKIATVNASGDTGDQKYEEAIEVVGTSEVNASADGTTVSGIVSTHYTTNAGHTVFASAENAHDADTYGKFRLEFTNKYGYWKLTSATNLGE